MNPNVVLGSLPQGLRDPLVDEYRAIVQAYCESRWSPSELSGGKFCEIVFTILEGHASSSYVQSPRKPPDFVGACRKLEQNTHVPRSLRILIPRLLPAIYEIRNNRGVGHVGGEVDPNYMDASFVVSSCNWVMAELIRVFHSVSVDEAQIVVDRLVQRRVPIVWEGTGVRRVLNPKLRLRSQILMLLATSSGPVLTSELLTWVEYGNPRYFKTVLRGMHKDRLVELSADDECVEILPPGDEEATKVIKAEAQAAQRSDAN